MADKTYEEAVSAYLNMALQEGNFADFIEGIGHIARAHGVSTVARSSGLGRESLYKALSKDSKPRFETICKVMQSIGLELIVVPAVRKERNG